MKKATCCSCLATATLLCLPSQASPRDFKFEVGGPVAAQDFRLKAAPFVFRTTGCADLSNVVVSAKAEGIVQGARQSIALRVVPSAKPGVYGVLPQWTAGRWTVILQGSCGSQQAGAVVPIGATGFVRDAAKFYAHPATPAEIEDALKAFPEGGYK
jgi:hypothetical protein